MRENQAQYPSGEVNRKLTEILPIIQRYTESAAFILANAFSHPLLAIASAYFNVAFDKAAVDVAGTAPGIFATQ